jgi:cell division transport system permease protein
MSGLISSHGRALDDTFARLVRSPLGSLLNIVVIGISLSLPLGLYAVLQNVQDLGRGWQGEPELFVFLEVDAESADTGEIESRLRSRRDLAGYRFEPRAKALAELKATTGLGELIDSLGRNPLPDGFVVRASSGAPADLEALRAEILSWPKVDHVQLDTDWARKLDAALSLGRLAILVLAVLLGVAVVALTFNTIRLQIVTRRQEIEVASLIGATPSFVRRPFLYFGFTVGLLGGAAACLIVAAGIRLLSDRVAEIGTMTGWNLALHPPGLAENLAVLGVAAVLGWFGAWLSASVHLMQAGSR